MSILRALSINKFGRQTTFFACGSTFATHPTKLGQDRGVQETFVGRYPRLHQQFPSESRQKESYLKNLEPASNELYCSLLPVELCKLCLRKWKNGPRPVLSRQEWDHLQTITIVVTVINTVIVDCEQFLPLFKFPSEGSARARETREAAR